jgi:hypothetical protein
MDPGSFPGPFFLERLVSNGYWWMLKIDRYALDFAAY